MFSILELLVVIGLALVLAQCTAWAVQRLSPPERVRNVDTKTPVPRERWEIWGETTKASFHYVRRRTRYQVHCPVLYQIDSKAENGVVVDMSREGWRIKGRGHVSAGTAMSLAISLPGRAAPVPISRAVVRWSEGEEFGISLVALDQGPAVQLSEFFSTLTPVPQADLSAA